MMMPQDAPAPQIESLNTRLANATVFVSSLCVMVIELVAGRMIAGDLGSSLYTWTSIIGTVLAGLAIGNVIGGRLADRFPSRKTLANLFLLSSVLAASIALWAPIVGDWPTLWTLPWPVRVASHVAVIFFLPAMMLGTISPVAARMALEQSDWAGRTIGGVFAWGAIGSIVGTFLTGFLLIALLSTGTIIWSVAGALTLMAVLYAMRAWHVWIWVVMLSGLCVLSTSSAGVAQTLGSRLGIRYSEDPELIFKRESQYSTIRILESADAPGMRSMMLNKLIHSRIDLQNPGDLQYNYEKVFAAVTKRMMKGKTHLSSLTIGGGGYVFPRYIIDHWPDHRTEVAEIDPAVTDAARTAFGLPADAPIIVHHMDGRVLVEKLHSQMRRGAPVDLYDVIMCDAVDDYNVPFQLTTVEFIRKVSELLEPEGAYLVNVIEIYDSGRLMGALLNTMQEVFPHVAIVAEGDPLKHPQERNTFVLVGSRRPLDTEDLGQEYGPDCTISSLSETGMSHLKDRSSGIVLTDNYAPIESLLEPVVADSARRFAVSEFAIRADRCAAREEFAHALVWLEKGLKRFPEDSELRYHHAITLQQMGRNDEAIRKLQELVSHSGEFVDAWYALGNNYYRMKQAHEAENAFRKGLQLKPNNPDFHFSLGNALAAQGKLAEAARCYRTVLQLQPDDSDAKNHLNVIQVHLGRSADPMTDPAKH